MGHLHAYTPRFLRRLVRLHGFEIGGLEADRVNLPLLGWADRQLRRRLAGIGSVLILWAHLARRVRVEDASRQAEFPGSRAVGLRSIEVPRTQ
jgi:hypothetical protein